MATALPKSSRFAALRATLRDGGVWRRTLILGLPVGLMQATLNQGDHWFNHHVTGVVLAKSILSPLLSCSIAFASAASTRTAQTPKTSP